MHDAWDALLGLFQHAHSWGLDAQKIAVGGDSAGGTLAAVCAVLARDAGLPLALQLLFYPGCLAQQDSASHRTFAVDLEIYRGVTHEFIKMDRLIPEAQCAHHDAAQALRAALLPDH